MLAAVVSVTGCALVVNARHDAAWSGRNIEELVRVVGPYDASLIRGDTRTYTWYRLGACRLDARTSLDQAITTVQTIGTAQGCSVYLERMRAG